MDSSTGVLVIVVVIQSLNLWWMWCTMKRQDHQMSYMKSLDRSIEMLGDIIFRRAPRKDPTE